MLTEVAVRVPEQPNKAPLSLPIGTGGRFPIVFIDGLNPPSAEVSTHKYASLPGERFSNSKANMRNIVLTVDLIPDYRGSINSVTQLRAELYSYFQPGKEVSLEFDDTILGKLSISGYVETFEAPLFVKDPGAQISIVCPDPYLESDIQQTSTHVINNDTPAIIQNNGDVNVGVNLELSVGVTSEPVEIIFGPDGTSIRNYMTFNTTITNLGGIYLTSIVGEKSAVLESTGGTTNLYPYLTLSAGWIELVPGSNFVQINAGRNPSTSHYLTLKWKERYLGL